MTKNTSYLVSKNLLKETSKFIKSIIFAPKRDDNDTHLLVGSIVRPIPSDLMEEHDDTPMHLSLTGKEARQYSDFFNRLTSELALEHLDQRALRAALWRFVCKAYLGRSELCNREELESIVAEFLNDVVKPLDDHEILFKLEHLDIDNHEIEFWGFRFFKMRNEQLKQYGMPEDALFRSLVFKEFADSPVLAVKETGNNFKLIVERARVKASFALRLLRFYFSHSLRLQDINLLFDVAEYALVKNLNSGLVGYSGKAKRKPFGLVYNQGSSPLIDRAQDHYSIVKDFSTALRKVIDIAIHWYGVAIELENPDEKVVALCTAMEALLTKRGDKKKGEAIAYRMALLAAERKRGFIDLDRLLWIYELRSKLVHGSTMLEATNSEYSTLQLAFRETFDNYITVVNTRGAGKPSKLFELLERSEFTDKLLDGLTKRGTEESLKIRDALMESRRVAHSSAVGS